MRWQDKLTKSDHQHIRENWGARPTLSALVGGLRIMEREGFFKVPGCACFQCRSIARKLGILEGATA